MNSKKKLARFLRSYIVKNKIISLSLLFLLSFPLFCFSVSAETTQLIDSPYVVFSRPSAVCYGNDLDWVVSGESTFNVDCFEFWIENRFNNKLGQTLPRSYTAIFESDYYDQYKEAINVKRFYQSSYNGVNEQYTDFPIRYVKKGDKIVFNAVIDFTASSALNAFQPTHVYDTYSIRLADGTNYWINNNANITWSRINLDSYNSLPFPKEYLGTVKVNTVSFSYEIEIPQDGTLVDWGLHFSREQNTLNTSNIGYQFPSTNYLNYYFVDFNWTYTTSDENALLNGIANNNQLVINQVKNTGDEIKETINTATDVLSNTINNAISDILDKTLENQYNNISVDDSSIIDSTDMENELLNNISGGIEEAKGFLSNFDGLTFNNRFFIGVPVVAQIIDDFFGNVDFFYYLVILLIPLGICAFLLNIVPTILSSGEDASGRINAKIDRRNKDEINRYNTWLSDRDKFNR